MNDELKTKEYFKSMEQIKLSDSSSERIKGDLLEYARFHAVAKESADGPIRSPFFMFPFKSVGAAFALVLIVGATSFLLDQTAPAGQLSMNDTNEPASVDDVEKSEVSATEDTPTPVTPTILAQNTGPQSNPEAADNSLPNAYAKVAPESATADPASDEMSIMLSQGTWSIEDHATDIKLRETSLSALIKKYDTKLEAEVKTEFKAKLNQAIGLVFEAEGKSETDARTDLDKASVLIGEVEATLSTFGQVEIVNGIIVDIDFD